MNITTLRTVVLRHRSVPIVAALIVVFALWAPRFMSTENLGNILLQASFDGVMVIGMAIALIGGQFDLSIGSILVMSAFLAVDLSTWGIVPAVGASVLAGMVVGLINGLLVTKARVNSFIATLGTMFAVRGLMLAYSGGFPHTGRGANFTELAGGMLGPVAVPVLICLLLGVAAHTVLSHTRAGRKIYALGGNAEFFRLAGEPIHRFQICLFLCTGATAGLGGALLASRLGAASPVLGNDTAMTVVSAVILGGISLSGGVGSVPQAIEGILTISILDNGMNLLGVPPYFQFVVRGAILISVVVLDAYMIKVRSKAGFGWSQLARVNATAPIQGPVQPLAISAPESERGGGADM